MKHYGDITKINGAEVPIVDIITFGAPCQDLSVAGKRAGMKSTLMGDEENTRSGLFHEAIRLIKESRNECIRQLSVRGTDVDIRLIKPRYAIYENVPGAFSSNKGEDFRCVLEELCRIADQTATIPMPEKGKWSTSGCVMGDGWSVAWRLHDAQFWGVPQRRKRISVVADFGGTSAPEILFESESLSGNIEQSEQERKEITRSIGAGVEESDSAYTLKIRGGCERDSNGKRAGKGALVQTEKSGTLGVSQDQTLIQCLNGWDVQSKHIQSEDGVAEPLYSGECRGGGGESYVMQGCSWNGDQISSTLTANNASGCQRMPDKDNFNAVLCIGNGQTEQTRLQDKVGTLNCMHDQQAILTVDMGGGKSSCVVDENKSPTLTTTHYGEPAVCYGLDRASFNQGQNAQYDFSVQEEVAQTLVAKGPGGGTSETVGALCARDYKGVGNQYVNEGKCIVQRIE